MLCPLPMTIAVLSNISTFAQTLPLPEARPASPVQFFARPLGLIA
jgi:hypothetical protein